MDKLITPVLKITKEIFRTTRPSVIPFIERPGEEIKRPGSLLERDIKAEELFAFFTANIINEKVIFTR